MARSWYSNRGLVSLSAKIDRKGYTPGSRRDGLDGDGPVSGLQAGKLRPCGPTLQAR